MQALQVSSLTPDLSGVSIADQEPPVRKTGEVLVKVAAASLNFPDLLMTQGKYQYKPELPFVSGLEMAGEVVEADPNSPFKSGDEVMGGAKVGGFAEYVSLPVTALRKVPAGLSLQQGASLGAAYTTAYTTLFELAGLQKDQWVLVTGASGGVGLAAVDLALAKGARVIAATGTPSKIGRIEELYGPDAVILGTGPFRALVEEITDGHLADIVCDPVGGDVFDEATRCVSFGGQIMVVGFASGRIPEIATNIPLIKGFSVVGVRAGEYSRRFPARGRAIAAQISALASSGAISPAIDRTLPLSQWRDGFQAMIDRELVGKVVFEPGK